MDNNPTQAQPTEHPYKPDVLYLTIRDRQNLLFNGEVNALTSTNTKGQFDILPGHENFISIVKDVITVHKTDGKDQDIKLSNGILRAVSNDVSVYVGISAGSSAAPSSKS